MIQYKGWVEELITPVIRVRPRLTDVLTASLQELTSPLFSSWWESFICLQPADVLRFIVNRLALLAYNHRFRAGRVATTRRYPTLKNYIYFNMYIFKEIQFIDINIDGVFTNNKSFRFPLLPLIILKNITCFSRFVQVVKLHKKTLYIIVKCIHWMWYIKI